MLIGRPQSQPWCLNLIFGVVIVVTILFATANAQDLEPRKYTNTPVGQNFLRVAGGYSWGEVELTPGLPFSDANLKLTGASLSYLRTLDVGGNAASIDMYMIYSCASGSVQLDGVRQDGHTCGNGDAKLRFTWNFIGAPALQIGDFVRQDKEMVIGASVQVLVPVGHYNSDRLLNIGANRWVLRPEIGMSLPHGKWNFEFSAGARFYQDNEEYLVDSTLKQNPVYNLQIHVVYDVSLRQWLSVNANYFFGGETFVNDLPSLAEQGNSRLGITWNTALNSSDILQISVNTGVITRVGNDSTNVSVAWIHRWE